MVQTPSTMLELGTPAPEFSLQDTEGRTVTRSQFEGQPLLVAFVCNHCPFVRHIHDKMVEVFAQYQDRGVGVVAVNANIHPDFPEDSPDKMREYARRYGYKFPYVADPSQEVAKAYRAACTPDFFVFDRAHRLAYRGQFDESRPGNDKAVTGRDLCAALDAVLDDRPVPEAQRASIGCNIKWRPGNEPEYFRR